jgi:hypothetical protein
MGSKRHATFAAVLLASAIGFAGASLAATTVSDSGSGRDSIDVIKSAVGNTKTSTSNRAANRSRATRASVERKEAEITRQLNTAIATNAGTPSAAPQAALPRPASPTINEAGAPVAPLPPPPPADLPPPNSPP